MSPKRGRGAPPIDATIERGDDPDPGPVRACDEIGIREVESEEVVELDGTLEQIARGTVTWLLELSRAVISMI